MLPLTVRLLVDTLVQLVVLPEVEKRFGGTVPGDVLAAVTRRITKIVAEAQAADYTTLRKLTLYALDEAVRHYEERPA